MEQQAAFSPDWTGHTVLHPLALAAVVLLGVLLLVVPRRFAVLPMLLMACLMAPAQRLVVFGLDYNLLRILVLVGWVRILCRGELRSFRWHSMDLVLVLWALSATTHYTLLYGSVAALLNRLGVGFDAVGMYFLFRCFVRSRDDLRRVITIFIGVSVPVAIAFVVEMSTGRNAFAFLGGVPEITVVREGRLRCQGAFSHPILAGCFWASLMPLMAARWWEGPRSRLASLLGLGMSSIIVICCASSTPITAVVAAVAGAFLFPLRYHMRWVRWGAVCSLVILHLAMKQPVWHLLARVNVVGGSTGWHRFQVIDQAILHFDEWWLFGQLSTDGWNIWAGDITNHFVLEGLRGGMLTLCVFVAAIACGFRAVGRCWRTSGANKADVALDWAMGLALFVHCVNFIGVAYFGQIMLVWYMVLAVIASVDGASAAKRAQVVRNSGERKILRARHGVRQTVVAGSAGSESPRYESPGG